MLNACQFAELVAVARCADDNLGGHPHIGDAHLHKLCCYLGNIHLFAQVNCDIHAVSDESLPLLVGIRPAAAHSVNERAITTCIVTVAVWRTFGVCYAAVLG